MELILTEIDQMYGISIKKTGLQHLNGFIGLKLYSNLRPHQKIYIIH